MALSQRTCLHAYHIKFSLWGNLRKSYQSRPDPSDTCVGKLGCAIVNTQMIYDFNKFIISKMLYPMFCYVVILF